MIKYMKGKYKIVTFGCQMNVHESEKAAGLLEEMGYAPTESAEDADVVLFNTCCIRDTAEKRAFGNIGALKSLKRSRSGMLIIVLGCMTEQDGYTELFKSKYPFVDIVLGTRNLSVLRAKIEEKVRAGKRVFDTAVPENFLEADENTPVTRTSYPNAWLNIMYGCNNFCSYCIVPYVRGREVSRDIESILSEAREVVAAGYKEITLLGQNVNSYNGNGVNFAELLQKIDQIEGKFRIRFMTSHPKDFNEEIAAVMAASSKICNGIHLPVQAGSNAVLKSMNRRYTREKYLSLVDMMREKLGEGVGITTDIMVGFPGETDADFNDTMELVRTVRFSNAFTFIYSPRKGTPAASMPQIPYEVKRARIGELIKLQNAITKELSDAYMGKIEEILIEDLSAKYDGSVCGRTESGRLVTVKGEKDLIGSFKTVEITASKSASLFGEILL
jgi:tRNA-2-methylthio-N6-dimethylallyladenosine synthase